MYLLNSFSLTGIFRPLLASVCFPIIRRYLCLVKNIETDTLFRVCTEEGKPYSDLQMYASHVGAILVAAAGTVLLGVFPAASITLARTSFLSLG
jgi:hypothetical protein